MCGSSIFVVPFVAPIWGVRLKKKKTAEAASRRVLQAPTSNLQETALPTITEVDKGPFQADGHVPKSSYPLPTASSGFPESKPYYFIMGARI